MLDSTLTLMEVAGPLHPAELRAFAGALGEAGRLPGFLESHTFRGIHDTATVLVYARWRDAAAQQLGLRLAERAGRAAKGQGSARVLETCSLSSTYDFQFAPTIPRAVVIRLSRGSEPAGAATDRREKELALRVMAHPGSIRAAGARNARRQLSLCRIEFDHEDALWRLLESPLGAEWAQLAKADGRREVWALNLPRFCREAFDERAMVPGTRQDVETIGPLSLELRVPSDREAEILLHGRMDARGALRLSAIVDALARDGCRHLTLDIRELETLVPEAMRSLLETVRRLRGLGGEVRLIEKGDRFNRTTRSAELGRLTLGTGEPDFDPSR